MHGMPTYLTIEHLYKKHQSFNSGFVIIFDDCLADLENLSEEETENMTRLITQWARHRNISLYFTLQNVFTKSRVVRTLRSNIEQLLLFSVTSGMSSVKLLLSRTLGTQNSAVTSMAYQKSTRLKNGSYYGYLVVDFRIYSEVIHAYRLRNFFASFEDEAKQLSMKSLTRPDMFMYRIKDY